MDSTTLIKKLNILDPQKKYTKLGIQDLVYLCLLQLTNTEIGGCHYKLEIRKNLFLQFILE